VESSDLLFCQFASSDVNDEWQFASLTSAVPHISHVYLTSSGFDCGKNGECVFP